MPKAVFGFVLIFLALFFLLFFCLKRFEFTNINICCGNKSIRLVTEFFGVRITK